MVQIHPTRGFYSLSFTKCLHGINALNIAWEMLLYSAASTTLTKKKKKERFTYHLYQEWLKYSEMVRESKCFSDLHSVNLHSAYWNHSDFVCATQTDTRKAIGNGYVSINYYLQKQAKGWIWSLTIVCQILTYIMAK